MGNELLNLQGLALDRLADELNGFLRAVGDAHTTAHTGGSIDLGESVIYGDCRELAKVGAGAASSTQIDVHLGHKAGRGQHGRATLVGLHRPAAAGATVADSVESIEHRVLVQVDTIEHALSFSPPGWSYIHVLGGDELLYSPYLWENEISVG